MRPIMPQLCNLIPNDYISNYVFHHPKRKQRHIFTYKNCPFIFLYFTNRWLQNRVQAINWT